MISSYIIEHAHVKEICEAALAGNGNGIGHLRHWIRSLESNGVLVDKGDGSIEKKLDSVDWKDIKQSPYKDLIVELVDKEMKRGTKSTTANMNRRGGVSCVLCSSSQTIPCSYAKESCSVLEYLNSKTEKERERCLLMGSFSSRQSSAYESKGAFEQRLGEFARFSNCFELFDPQIGQQADVANSRTRYAKGISYLIKTLFDYSVHYNPKVTIYTKDAGIYKTRMETDIKDALAFSGVSQGSVIIQWTSRDFHDRFLTNDYYLCSIGKGVDVLKSNGDLTDINLFFCGAKVKVGLVLKELRDATTAIVTLL